MESDFGFEKKDEVDVPEEKGEAPFYPPIRSQDSFERPSGKSVGRIGAFSWNRT